MQRTLMGLSLALLLSSPGFAGRQSLTTSLDNDEELAGCDQIKIAFGDPGDRMETVRAEEHLTAPYSSSVPLRVDLAGGNGVEVRAGGGDAYAITVCEAAGARKTETARGLLEKISVSVRDGRVEIDGPAEEEWMVFLIVEAPRDARLELEAQNGPIGLRGVSGTIRVESRNGPISLRACSGDIQVESENGPITTADGSGHQRLHARNGPLDVKLAEGGWKGQGLRARTDNGPLSLKLPEEYGSGVRVEMSGHSPVSCHARECDNARKSWDEDLRSIEFGDGAPVVVLSTQNGPVSIKSRRGDDASSVEL